MAKKNEKHEKQPEQQPSKQSTAPVKPVELSEEELGQVVGGALTVNAVLDNTTKPAFIRDPGL